MKLRILIPSEVFLEEDVSKVAAEAENGAFCLLERHVDFTAALTPGLLSFETHDAEERFVGVDEGILVKCRDEILVSVRNAVVGPELGEVKKRIHEEFEELSEREKKARTASSKLEANLVRRFMELDRHGF